MKLSAPEIQGQLDYWIGSSKEKYKTMESLYRSRRYADCLFFGHLILEKTLKALVVEETEEMAPRIHNLPHLAEIAHIELVKEESELLSLTTQFNMRTRYPDDKLRFYKICTKAFTDRYYSPIKKLYHKLCQMLPSKEN